MNVREIAGVVFSVTATVTVCISAGVSNAGDYAPPAYTPIVQDDMEGGTGAYSERWDPKPWDDRKQYTTIQANSGRQSVSLLFKNEGAYYAGVGNLPTSVSIGETVWYRVYLYFPSTASFSSTGQGDYSGWGKFLVLSPQNHNTPRMYTQLPAPNRKNFGDSGFYGKGLRVDSDGMGTCNFGWEALPRDKWFSLQMAWKLSSTNGWVRLWVDDKFVGQCATTVPGGYSVASWGIGNYWNGGAWVKNGSTPAFFMDDVVITKQTPNTTDDGGRAFIHPLHFAGDKSNAPNAPTLRVE